MTVCALSRASSRSWDWLRFPGIVQGCPDLLGFRFRRQCAGRANRRAEAATDAFHFAQVASESRSDAGGGTAMDEIDRADRLDLLAGPNTIAAQNALVRVPYQRRRRVIHGQIPIGPSKPHLVDPQSPAEILQLAGSALRARRAGLGMIRQQQLQRDLPQFTDLFGVSAHHHPRLGPDRATGDNSSALDFHQAQAAGAVDAQVGMVAECGNIDPRITSGFQQAALAVDRNNSLVDRYRRLIFHEQWSWRA